MEIPWIELTSFVRKTAECRILAPCFKFLIVLRKGTLFVSCSSCTCLDTFSSFVFSSLASPPSLSSCPLSAVSSCCSSFRPSFPFSALFSWATTMAERSSMSASSDSKSESSCIFLALGAGHGGGGAKEDGGGRGGGVSTS